MSMTLAQLQEVIVRRVRAEESAPTVSDLDIDSNTVTNWLNDLTSQVVDLLRHNPQNYKDFQELVYIDKSLTLDANAKTSISSLSSEYILAVKCGTQKYDADVLYDPRQFSFYDSSNWLLEVDANKPKALVAEGKIFVKPVNTYKSGKIYVDHTIPHPTISSSQGTVFSPIGNDILIELFMSKYFSYMADLKSDPVLAALAGEHLENALSIANGIDIFTSKKRHSA